jgi:RNA polymerase sigma factor (sigma-70 family)
MSQVVDDDRELVRRAKTGDFEAFESLVALYEQRIFSLAARIVRRQHDAEEVVQQTFLSVIEHLGEFREQSRFSTWLMRIATNHALLLLRKRYRQRTVPLVDDHGESEDYAPRTPDAGTCGRGKPGGPGSRTLNGPQLVDQCSAADAEFLGGVRAIAVAFLQGGQNSGTLNLRKASRRLDVRPSAFRGKGRDLRR